jgi:putative membrane protein
MYFIEKYFPHFLLAVYIIEFILLGINPVSRDVWWAENLPIMILVASIVVLYVRGIRFSNPAYLMMFILPFWHTIGGHFTFERVPFDWFNNLFGFERNMFDRIGHFSVGLYAYPVIEYFKKYKVANSHFVTYTYAIFFVAFVAMSYELIEWQYAVREGGEAGLAFLGSQGDIWDAQKDMLMDTLGAIVAGIAYWSSNVFQQKDSSVL